LFGGNAEDKLGRLKRDGFSSRGRPDVCLLSDKENKKSRLEAGATNASGATALRQRPSGAAAVSS
jgi:hypothetical protein